MECELTSGIFIRVISKHFHTDLLTLIQGVVPLEVGLPLTTTPPQYDTLVVCTLTLQFYLHRLSSTGVHTCPVVIGMDKYWVLLLFSEMNTNRNSRREYRTWTLCFIAFIHPTHQSPLTDSPAGLITLATPTGLSPWTHH